MISDLVISALQQLLAAAIDALRIRWRWATVGNIEHGVSCVIGATLAVCQWFILRPHWHPVIFALLCCAWRLLLYDPALNLLRRERIGYQSPKTNARTATWWRRLNVPFIWQRVIGAAAIGICLLIQSLL